MSEIPRDIEGPLSNYEAARAIPHLGNTRSQTILAAGVKGSGKTTLIREWSQTLETRCLTLDPFRDFGPDPWASDIDSALWQLRTLKPCRLRLSPPIGAGSRDYADRLFSSIVRWAEHGAVWNMVLCMDEISLWSGLIPSQSLETLILQGRRLGIRMVIGCQRISRVPGLLLSETTHLAMFHMARPRDLLVAAEWSNRSTAAMLPSLEVGQCFLVRP